MYVHSEVMEALQSLTCNSIIIMSPSAMLIFIKSCPLGSRLESGSNHIRSFAMIAVTVCSKLYKLMPGLISDT